jgi:hypothetical protein
MLVEILGGNSIPARCRFARQGEVALKYLVGAAADFDVGPVAVERLTVLRDSRLVSKRAICVNATAGPPGPDLMSSVTLVLIRPPASWGSPAR